MVDPEDFEAVGTPAEELIEAVRSVANSLSCGSAMIVVGLLGLSASVVILAIRL